MDWDDDGGGCCVKFSFPKCRNEFLFRRPPGEFGTVIFASCPVEPALLWVILTTLVGIFTREYWWPFISDLMGLG